MKKSFFVLMLTTLFLLPSMTVYALNAQSVRFPIYVDNVKKDTKYPVYVIDGRTYLSLRDFSKFFGAEIKWDDDSKKIQIFLTPSSKNQDLNAKTPLNNLIGTWKGKYSNQFGPHDMTIVFEEMWGEIVGTCFFSGDIIGNGTYTCKAKMNDDGFIELIGDAWIMKQPSAYPMQDKYSMIDVKVKFQDNGNILDGKSDDNYKITLYKE